MFKITQQFSFFLFNVFFFIQTIYIVLTNLKQNYENLFLHSHLVCLQYFQNQQMCSPLHLQIIVCMLYTNINGTTLKCHKCQVERLSFQMCPVTHAEIGCIEWLYRTSYGESLETESVSNDNKSYFFKIEIKY